LVILRHIPPKAESGVSGEESEAAGLLLAYRPDYLFPVTTMHFLTNPVKAGTREWVKCACWVLVRRAQFRFCYGGMCLVLSDDPKICYIPTEASVILANIKAQSAIPRVF
jgi:hypothetical protein